MALTYAKSGVAISGLRDSRRRSADAKTRIVADRPVLAADPYRHVVFPNAVRDIRVAKGHIRLLSFSARLPDIPYVRLSKIERGEVFARAEELVRIAAALDVAPARLLIDVTSPAFDIATWAACFADKAVVDDPAEARIAVLLAAAVRRARCADPRLTASVISDMFGIAPVILSRVENAHKGLSRWSPDVVAAIGRLLGDRDEATLRRWLEDQHAQGALDRFLRDVGGAADREDRSRQRIAALTVELDRVATEAEDPASPRHARPGRTAEPHRIALYGIPDVDGKIALTPTGDTIASPPDTGAHAFGVRIARATLGPGLPAGTIVVVDPDRYPRGGGLALVREGERYRLVAVIADRTGALTGYSLYPKRDVAMDALEAGAAAAVTSALFA